MVQIGRVLKGKGGRETGLNFIAIDIPFTRILFYVNSALNDSFASETTFQVLPFFRNFGMFLITFSLADWVLRLLF